MADVLETNDFEEEKMEVKSDSDDPSSSSEDAMDDEDDKMHNEIVNLEAEVKHSPYIYNKHIELIKLCRKDGELEKLRDARERMTETFPLDEDLWLEWIEDEIKFMNAESKKDRAQVESLFEKCVQDYMSVPLWLEYVQFSIGGMGSEGGVAKVREVFEKAITAVGIHPTKGSNIWEAYREFENAVLGGLQPELGGIPSKEQQEEVDAQIDKITAIFKRQLQIPLFEMEQTYEEYKEWNEEEDKHLEDVYKRKLVKLKALVPFENELLKGDSPSYDSYIPYIEYELSGKEPARIQNLFERAIKGHCLQPDIWIKYTRYLDENIKIKSIIMPVYERAVRNCPWSVEIWSRYIRAMERHHEPHKIIVALFDKALNFAGFTQGSDFLQIWMVYLDYLRRRIDVAECDHDEPLELLRKTFPLAIDHVLSIDGGLADPTASLQRFWASIEARRCNNIVKAREIWHEIMQQGYATQSQTWIEFFNLERACGDAKHCRKILLRAINSVTDWPETMCEVYINYEREEGTLDDYDTAVSKVEAQLLRVAERREKEVEKEALAAGSKRPDKKAGKKEQQQTKGGGKQQSHQKPGKHQMGVMHNAPMGVKRKHEDNGSDDSFKKPAPKSDTGTFKAPAPKGPPPPGFKSPPPPGYKTETDDEPSQKKTKGNTESEDGAGGYQHDASKDLVTVFVSNISYRVKEQRLKEMFSQCGEVAEIRLVKTLSGASKGYAYVEFTSQAAATKALAMDRQTVEKRPMFVSPCNEKRSKTFRFGTGLEKNKLFIKNLPYTCTKEALQNIFGQHGKVKDVRMVTYKTGAPKGLAYVEFETEQEASAAVMKTDNLLVGEHNISVAISLPPERRPEYDPKAEKVHVRSLGSGKRESAGRGKSHSLVSLLPRALQKKQEPAKPKVETQTQTAKKQEPAKPKDETQPQTAKEQEPAKPKEETQPQTTKMSNADFRNLLLKK